VLFHGLIANHPFDNGNKRTAVVALDLFLAANSIFLFIQNDGMYRLAKLTADYRAQGISHDDVLATILVTIRQHSAPFGQMRKLPNLITLIEEYAKLRKTVRGVQLNHPQPHW
jgi:hypothetical protein